ncbi:MAG: hypothetical protein ACRC0U_00720 [Vibrio sp.]
MAYATLIAFLTKASQFFIIILLIVDYYLTAQFRCKFNIHTIWNDALAAGQPSINRRCKLKSSPIPKQLGVAGRRQVSESP